MTMRCYAPHRTEQRIDIMRRALIGKVFLVLLSCVIGLLLAEIILRFLPWQGLQRKLYLRHYNVFTYDPEKIQFDPVLGYRIRPNLNIVFDGREFSTEVSTNSAGFRDSEKALDSPGAILFGDSYCFGWGVEKEQGVEHLLEEALGFEVLNTAAPGYGTMQQWLLLKQLAEKTPLEDVLVLFLLSPNDLRDNVGYGWGIMPAGEIVNGELNVIPPRRGGLEEVWFDWYTSITRKACQSSRLCSLALVVSPVVSAEKTSDTGRYVLFDAILDRLVELRDKHGFRLAFFSIPPMKDRAGWYPEYSKRMKRMIGSHSIPYGDLAKVLTFDDCYPLDRHWNPQGHQKVAEFIFQSLNELGWLKSEDGQNPYPAVEYEPVE